MMNVPTSGGEWVIILLPFRLSCEIFLSIVPADCSWAAHLPTVWCCSGLWLVNSHQCWFLIDGHSPEFSPFLRWPVWDFMIKSFWLVQKIIFCFYSMCCVEIFSRWEFLYDSVKYCICWRSLIVLWDNLYFDREDITL